METKLITKTIKELADELDGNVDQLHRTIVDQDVQIKYLKNENENLWLIVRKKQPRRIDNNESYDPSSPNGFD